MHLCNDHNYFGVHADNAVINLSTGHISIPDMEWHLICCFYGSRHFTKQAWDFVPGLNLSGNKPGCSRCFGSADGHSIKQYASLLATWHDLPFLFKQKFVPCHNLCPVLRQFRQ